MSQYILNFDYLANVSFDQDSLKYYGLYCSSMYNKNSNHRLGSNTNKIYDISTENVLKCFDGYKYVEFIPGGASMANKRSILGSIPTRPKIIDGIRKDIILVSSIEHTSIINYIVPILLNNDYTVMMIQCENNGTISLDNLEQLLECYGKRIVLVSIMNVNNETGIIQNVPSYASKVKEFDQSIIFHSDITQGLSVFWNQEGKYKPDILTFSGYKLGGPHLGIVISKYKLSDDYTGTPDVASIYTLSIVIENKFQKDKLCELKYQEVKIYILDNILRWFNDNNIKYNLLSTIGNSLNNIISLLLYGYQGKIIQQMLSDEDICIGAGSACQSGKQSGSHVIRGMGYSTEVTFNLVRISWGDIINVNESGPQDNIKNKEYAMILINNFCKIVDKMKPLIRLPKSILSSTKLKGIFEPIVKRKETLDKFGKMVDNIHDYDLVVNILTRRIKLSISETFLKGGNKYKFVNDLKLDILNRVPDKNIWDINSTDGSIILSIKDQNLALESQSELIYSVVQILKYIPGISLIIPQYSIPSYSNQDTLNKLMKVVMYLYNSNRRGNESIAIRTTINSKLFLNYKSQELNIILGELLVEKFKAPVNLKNPHIEFNIEINQNRINVSIERFVGIVGLPLGSEGNVAIILNNKNSLRSLISAIQLSTRGSKIVCYSYIDIKDYDKVIRKINPYITYKLIKMEDNIIQLLSTISERNVIYEINTSNFIPYINYLKELGDSYGKYITTVTSHMLFDDILKYLSGTGIDYFIPLYDDELIQDTVSSYSYGIISMISGGIDSPVSTKLMYDYCKSRGLPIKLIHFSSNINKVDVVKGIRDKIDKNLELYIIDFSNLQEEITKVCPEKYRTMLYKIFMVQITNKIGEIDNLQCIVMGNSWGQVASQTCENLYITNKFSKLPIYNPLLGLPKIQIISRAREIDTYNASICTGTNDCCIMYLPKHPVLKANGEIIRDHIEKFSNFMDLIKIMKV